MPNFYRNDGCCWCCRRAWEGHRTKGLAAMVNQEQRSIVLRNYLQTAGWGSYYTYLRTITKHAAESVTSSQILSCLAIQITKRTRNLLILFQLSRAIDSVSEYVNFLQLKEITIRYHFPVCFALNDHLKAN